MALLQTSPEAEKDGLQRDWPAADTGVAKHYGYAFQWFMLALTLLAAVLDGYSGARLERALTQGENRLADSVGAHNGLMGRGPQFFYLDGVPAKGQSPEALEAALRAQVQRVATEGVTEAELQRVKTQWVASEIYKLDSVFNQARELGVAWTLGLPPDHGAQLMARLRQVTINQRGEQVMEQETTVFLKRRAAA